MRKHFIADPVEFKELLDREIESDNRTLELEDIRFFLYGNKEECPHDMDALLIYKLSYKGSQIQEFRMPRGTMLGYIYCNFDGFADLEIFEVCNVCGFERLLESGIEIPVRRYTYGIGNDHE